MGISHTTHLQIVEGPLLHLRVHWHQCFVVSGSPSGGRVHLPGLAHCHGRPGTPLQGVAMVTAVMPASFVACQSHGGASHALPGTRCDHPLFGPLHGELLDGCVQTLVPAGVPPPASAHQKAAVAVQVVVGAPPARRPAPVAPARLVPGVSALAPLS